MTKKTALEVCKEQVEAFKKAKPALNNAEEVEKYGKEVDTLLARLDNYLDNSLKTST